MLEGLRLKEKLVDSVPKRAYYNSQYHTPVEEKDDFAAKIVMAHFTLFDSRYHSLRKSRLPVRAERAPISSVYFCRAYYEDSAMMIRILNAKFVAEFSFSLRRQSH